PRLEAAFSRRREGPMKFLAAVALALASPAAAEVVSADNHGFEVSQSVLVKLSAPDALTAFTRVSSWWMSDHTCSGSLANITIDARTGGCICERFPTGVVFGVMRV